MPLKHRATKTFWQQFNQLPALIQQQAKRQFANLKSNASHPSLHFKKVGQQGSQELWSARVSLNYRALALKRHDGYLWFWIGNHKTYDELIK